MSPCSKSTIKLFLPIMNVIVKLCLVILVVQNVQSADICQSTSDVYKTAAVGTNGPECAPIASNILKRGGTAVDAAVAALFCEGIASIHSMGLGGGFLMTIYDGKSGKAEFLDARETAPSGAHKNMFDKNPDLALYGGLAVAVPGSLMGYWEVHQKYGKLPWKELLEPTIKLCETGITITQYLYDSIQSQEASVLKEPTLSEFLVNPKTKKLWAVGDKIKLPKFKKTLEKLAAAKNPVDLFYRGSMRDDLVKEIRDYKGIITAEDFANYKVNWTKPIEAKVGDLTLYSAPPPGAGALFAFILQLLKGYGETTDKNVLWQRIVESQKWAYAKRTEFGDPHFVQIDKLLNDLVSESYANNVRKLIKDQQTSNDPRTYGAVTCVRENHGTAHISILAPDGSAVSVTASMNQRLGALFASKSTGIVFNDQMDDFSNAKCENAFGLPPSPNNFVAPNKRPQSSMTPVIVVDKAKKVKLLLGAAGGSKITSAVATIAYFHLFKKYSLKQAVDEHRIHHQIFPMVAQTEKGFSESVIKYLQKIGHKTETYPGIGSAIIGISASNDGISAVADCRRQGKTAGF